MPRTSQTFVGVKRGRAWHSTVHWLRLLASCRLLSSVTGRGLYDRPLTPPVVREAPQATRSLTGEKRDLEPSESVHLEFVVFPTGCCHSDVLPFHGIDNPAVRDGCQHVRDVSLLPPMRTAWQPDGRSWGESGQQNPRRRVKVSRGFTRYASIPYGRASAEHRVPTDFHAFGRKPRSYSSWQCARVCTTLLTTSADG